MSTEVERLTAAVEEMRAELAKFGARLERLDEIEEVCEHLTSAVIAAAGALSSAPLLVPAGVLGTN